MSRDMNYADPPQRPQRRLSPGMLRLVAAAAFVAGVVLLVFAFADHDYSLAQGSPLPFGTILVIIAAVWALRAVNNRRR